jgi:hypothetical protein
MTRLLMSLDRRTVRGSLSSAITMTGMLLRVCAFAGLPCAAAQALARNPIPMQAIARDSQDFFISYLPR